MNRAYELREEEVVEIIDGSQRPWIGRRKHVRKWALLKNGLAVGRNDNPYHGISFHVRKYK